MNPTTIKQLDKWMTDNCYNDNSYAIGDRIINEGCGLDEFGSLFVWYYTDRGKRENLDYFRTEQEAVEFAFKKITADKYAKSHRIGFIKDRNEVAELLAELANRNIEFWKEEIPILRERRTRIYVYGCDMLKVKDLQDKYNSEK